MRRLAWPLFALGVWVASWMLFSGIAVHGGSRWAGFTAGMLVSLAGGVLAQSTLRRVVIVGGFPLSLALSGLAGPMSAWWWLLPALVLLTLYPLRTWRDAPLFPTPPGALTGLARIAPLAGSPGQGGPRVLDAGCGLGDGLLALRAEYPHASVEGLEWSWPIRMACSLRCRFAEVRRGDLWQASWSPYDLVYLFQRPESMARAVDKARREMRPGAFLVSLDFEAPQLKPVAVLHSAAGRSVWVYCPSVIEPGRRLARPRPAGLLDQAGAPVAGRRPRRPGRDVVDVVDAEETAVVR